MLPHKGKSVPDTLLEDLPLDSDITSREGVSLDYIARVRVAYLLGQNSAMVTQTQFADAKAGALLAFVGLLATRGPGAVTDFTVITIENIFQVGLHAAAIVCCLIVLYPRYANKEIRQKMMSTERFSWPALASGNYSAEEFVDFMRGAQLSPMLASIARSNHALAGILMRKFAWLRAAFAVAVIDVAVMALRSILDTL